MDPVVAITLRAALAALFAAAASHKLRAPAHFAATVRTYRLVPDWAAPIAAASIVFAELGAAVLLIVPAGRERGSLAAAGLLALYAIAIGANLARGRRDIDCGCAAPGTARVIHGGLVWRNVALLLVALATLVPESSRALGWMDAVTTAAATVSLAALYAAVDRLLANTPAMARIRGAA